MDARAPCFAGFEFLLERFPIDFLSTDYRLRPDDWIGEDDALRTLAGCFGGTIESTLISAPVSRGTVAIHLDAALSSRLKGFRESLKSKSSK